MEIIIPKYKIGDTILLRQPQLFTETKTRYCQSIIRECYFDSIKTDVKIFKWNYQIIGSKRVFYENDIIQKL